jgi:hypothetical protein
MNTGILEQWRQARRHPYAALMGGLLGGFPPLAAYWTVHHDLSIHTARDLLHPMVPVVAACVLFSVSTVWEWGRSATRRADKPVYLVIALEGVMVLAPTPWLALLALLYLICINAVATACILAHEDVPQPQGTVTTVARERSLPRREAAKVVDRQLAQKPRPA